jgi:hypothetical protein
MFGMWQATHWTDLPVTSFELLVAGGALLICAAALLSVRKKNRVVLESSVVTEELIAITKDVLLRLQEMANVKQKVKEMPLTFSDR